MLSLDMEVSRTTASPCQTYPYYYRVGALAVWLSPLWMSASLPAGGFPAQQANQYRLHIIRPGSCAQESRKSPAWGRPARSLYHQGWSQDRLLLYPRSCRLEDQSPPRAACPASLSPGARGPANCAYCQGVDANVLCPAQHRAHTWRVECSLLVSQQSQPPECPVHESSGVAPSNDRG